MNPLVARLQQAAQAEVLHGIEQDIDLVYIALMRTANVEAADARRAAEDAAQHTGSRRRELETVEHAHRARADRLRYLARAFQ